MLVPNLGRTMFARRPPTIASSTPRSNDATAPSPSPDRESTPERVAASARRSPRLAARLAFVVALAACIGVAQGQPRHRRASRDPEAPTFPALVQWMIEAPRAFEVEVRGTQTTGSSTQTFAMHGRLRWVTTQRRDRLAIEQTDFTGFEGTLAPATFARDYLLPFVDPIFDEDTVAVGVAHAGRTASEVRAAISRAEGEPSGNREAFERMISERGMTPIVEDFFSPFVGYARRPAEGESRVVGELPTTTTPFGPIDVPTRIRFESSEHADCPDGTRRACIEVRIVATPDEAGLGRAIASFAPPLPEGVRITRMELRDETAMLVRRAPERIERLRNHRVMHIHARHERHREEREIVGTDVTYDCRFVEGAR